MKFNLEQIVIFEGKKKITDVLSAKYKVIVWDYSVRDGEYAIQFEDGKIIYGISEHELSELWTQTTKE